MTEAEKLIKGTEYMEWFAIYVISAIVAYMLIRTYQKRRKGSLNLKQVTTTGPKIFAFAIGAALLLVSCSLNALFGLMLIKALPEYPVMGHITATLLGLGNLAAIFAIKQAVERGAAGDTRGMWIARGKWFAITCFSLMTASSIFLSLNGQLEHLNVVADAEIAQNDKLIAANENAIKRGAAIPSTSTAKFQNLLIKNSNGTSVRLTSVCTKNRGWYYNNSQTCRAYRSALVSSGQATRNAQLEQANITLGAASIALLKGKPPVFAPTFFGAPIDTKWAFFLVAVFMEIAAEVCLAYAFTKPKSRPSQNSGIKPAGISGTNPASQSASPKGLGGAASGGAGAEAKKPKPPATPKENTQFPKNQPKPALKGGQAAAIKALPNPFNNSVLEDELDDLLYQLAIVNPQTKVTSPEINKIISDHRGGKGVKQDRILAAFRRNSDVVLVRSQGKRDEFILRNVTYGAGSGNTGMATAEPGVSTLAGLPRA